MSESIKMPALGESVTEGTVATWLKQVGDNVNIDEPILEVSTDKVDTEVPSPIAGVLEKIEVPEGETVAVGTILAYIGDGTTVTDTPPADNTQSVSKTTSIAEPVAPVTTPTPAVTPVTGVPVSTPMTTPPAPSTPPATPVTPVPPVSVAKVVENHAGAYVTPIVRKLAKELAVDLETVKGTGVGGRIRRQDIEVAAAAKLAATQPATPAVTAGTATNTESVKSQLAQKAATVASKRGTQEKMTRLRATIASRMVESLATSAQLTTVMEVDVTRIVNLRTQVKDNFQAREGTKLTFLPFFIKAATEALKAHPIINASVVGDEIVYHQDEHVGIAVDTEKGLFVPVIKNAGNLNIAGIAKTVDDLAKRTRSGKIDPTELSGSTFTITNTGSVGALMDTPIINQPNVAIMGTGAIFRAPAVVKDQDGNESIAIRSKCYLSISYDHRVVDGADASRYLRDVKLRLEEADFGSEVGL